MNQNIPNSTIISQNIVENCLNSNPALDIMLIATLNGKIQAMKTQDHEKDRLSELNSTLLSQIALALQDVSKILSNHLFLGDTVYEIEIVGNQKVLWIKNVVNLFFIQVVASAKQDVNELRDKVVEQILKDMLSLSAAKTISLVSSDGFPIWIVGKHNLSQVATVAANVLSAAERLSIELKLGLMEVIELCNAAKEGEENKTLVLFNEAQDLMLLLIGAKEDTKVVKIIELGRKIFRRFIRQERSTLVVPPDMIQEREERIKSILEETRDTSYSGNQQEELLSLRNFNESSIDQLESLLKELYRRYRCREVSIPYLRKRMKLPPSVINIILQSLMFEGRLGNSTIVMDASTQVPFLRLDWSVMRETIDHSLIREIEEYKNQIINRIIEHHFNNSSQFFLEELKPVTVEEPKDQVKIRVSEIQVLLDLVDTSEINFLSRTIRKEWQRLQELRKSSALLQKQLERQRNEQVGAEDNVVLMELERRYQALQRKRHEQNVLITSYKKNLDKTVKDVLMLIQRIFPEIIISISQRRKKKKKSSTTTTKLNVLVRCASSIRGRQCSSQISILSEDNYNWVRLFFIQMWYQELIGKQEILRKKSLDLSKMGMRSEIVTIKNSWEIIRTRYAEFVQDKENDMDESDLFSILESLEQLFFTNSELNSLYEDILGSGCYQSFSRCQDCGLWYCISSHFDSEREVCVFCLE